jgi:hypothetical protein
MVACWVFDRFVRRRLVFRSINHGASFLTVLSFCNLWTYGVMLPTLMFAAAVSIPSFPRTTLRLSPRVFMPASGEPSRSPPGGRPSQRWRPPLQSPPPLRGGLLPRPTHLVSRPCAARHGKGSPEASNVIWRAFSISPVSDGVANFPMGLHSKLLSQWAMPARRTISCNP